MTGAAGRSAFPLMLAPDQTLSDLALPALDLRAVARRAVLPALLLATLIGLACLAGGTAHTFLAPLRRGLDVNGGWVLAGVTCEFVSIAGYAGLLSLVAGRATNRVGIRESAQITLAGAAATRLLPTAGAGGAALTVWALRRAGLRPQVAARTLLAFLVLLYAVFLSGIIISGGALAVGLVHSTGPAALSAFPAAAALVAVVICLTLAARGESPAPAHDAGGRRSRISAGARLLGGAVVDARRLVRSRDPRIAGALAYWAFDAAVLWTTLHAFGSAAPLPVIALAYLVGQVANTLPIPGSVSGGIAGVMIAFGVPAELALPAVLTYRAIAVWMPTPVALAALPGLRTTIARWRREDVDRASAVDHPSLTRTGVTAG